MNTRRIMFWASFIIVLILIIWGLIVAISKENTGPVNKARNPAPVSLTDNVIGLADLPITIIEYSDFQCPACQVYYYVVEKLIASSSVPIRLVYRHFPLAQHQNAMPASLAAESAGVQGKFFDMYRLLFENQEDWAEIADPNSIFISYATDLGLNIEQFKKDMASSTLESKIKANGDEGTKIGVNSTPTFFINGKVIDNPQGYEAFKTLIEKAIRESSK